MVRLIAVLVACLATFSAASAQAQMVASTVEGVNAGVLTSDSQGPSGSTVISSLDFPGTATIDFSATGFGEAVQRPDGVGAVLADALFANGQTGNYVEARTTWTETATNTSGDDANYVFEFLITPPSLRIVDFAGLPDASMNQPDVSFRVTIRANSVIVFQSEAHLLGGNVSHVLNETGTSLGPSFTDVGPGFGYDFQSYADVLDLGLVPEGGSMTVEYEMVARVDTPGFEAGGRAEIGDPFDLDASPGFSGELRVDTPVQVDARSWGQLKSLYR